MPLPCLRTSRRTLLGLSGLAALAGLTGCSTPETPVGPQPSLKPSSTTPAPTPSDAVDARFDLFRPGRVTQVIDDLCAAVSDHPIVRVTITRTTASVTYTTKKDEPHTLKWDKGRITPNDEGTDVVSATPFDPHDFNLDDIAALFTQAAEISGSAFQQTLQITNFNGDQLAMTITTYPESITVFFNADGTLVPIIDLTTPEGISIGLADVTTGRSVVRAVGVTSGSQVWADVATDSGVLERRIRPSHVPMYRASRREQNVDIPFEPAKIDPEVIARLVRTGAGLVDGDPHRPTDLTISRPPDESDPVIVISQGTNSTTLSLDGEALSER